MLFTVTWLVSFWEQNPEKHYLVDERFEADDLDSLFDLLDEGQENMEFEPENKIADNWDLGSFNVDYAIITDADSAEVYRDGDFGDQVQVEQHKKT